MSGLAITTEPLSVIVPALDEGARLKHTVEDIRRALHGRPYEILVVDDGSRDGSAEGLEAEDLRVLRHSEPMGYGFSLKDGVRVARHGLIAIIDADGTYRAEDLVRLADLAPGREMVVGARTGPGARIPLIRRPAKWVLRRLAEYVAGTRIPDLNSGLRVFRREAALRHESILPHGFSFTSTLTIAVLADGRPVTYLPIEYLDRDGGKSKIRPLRDTFNFTALILRTAAFFRPARVFVPLGFALLTLAAARISWDVFVAHDIGDLSNLLLQAGLQVSLMGMVAELVVRRK